MTFIIEIAKQLLIVFIAWLLLQGRKQNQSFQYLDSHPYLKKIQTTKICTKDDVCNKKERKKERSSNNFF